MTTPSRVIVADVLSGGRQKLPGEPVEVAASRVVAVAESDVLVREGPGGYLARRAVLVREVAVADDLRPVLCAVPLQATEPKQRGRLSALHAKVWRKRPHCSFGRGIGNRPCPEGATDSELSPLLPERSSERSMKQLDRFPIDHLHGYPGMESRRGSSLASVRLGLLDSDVSLPVDDPGEVGECKNVIL